MVIVIKLQKQMKEFFVTLFPRLKYSLDNFKEAWSASKHECAVGLHYGMADKKVANYLKKETAKVYSDAVKKFSKEN